MRKWLFLEVSRLLCDLESESAATLGVAADYEAERMSWSDFGKVEGAKDAE